MRYLLVLSDNEVEQIKSGEHILKTYHAGNKLRLAVIHNGELTEKELEQKTKGVIQSGDDVMNVPLDEGAQKQIYVGAVRQEYEDEIEMIITSEIIHEKALQTLDAPPSSPKS